MLAKRDQWLPHIIAAHNETELRNLLELSLTAVREDAIAALELTQPMDLMADIDECLLQSHPLAYVYLRGCM